MIPYHAPSRDMQFVINELNDLEEIAQLHEFADHDIGPDLVNAVLEEAGKLAHGVLAPLNRDGDQNGATLGENGVKAVRGFGEAYRQFIEGGWNGLVCPIEFGGQGLPELLNIATQEMWNSANLAFALCPLLTAGAVEALRAHGSEEQKQRYLIKMISGEWTGTMNLTEPQAGSDLSAVRTRAVPEDGYYRLYGQKIFITWGDHDMTENVVHLVLARTPDAPEGVKGISLFIVPKYVLDEHGKPAQRNDVHCVSLEHKLGIHASPTCVMAYGDKEGAIGYLVGEENKGLGYMFTMMNEARLKVGLQGLAIGERAYQQACDFAKTRVQGRPVGVKTGERVTIIQHPDVRRMLLTMKAQNEAMRALCYAVARNMDLARHHPKKERRQQYQARIDLLIPVVKAWCTELGVEIASLGVQVHGGMGFIEETGAAQHLRDARITPIYEGTTGIQAADLVGRKIGADNGQVMAELIAEINALDEQLAAVDDAAIDAIRKPLRAGAKALQEATDWVVRTLAEQPDVVLAASVNYLMLTGYVCGGWQMARAALIAQERLATGDNSGFYNSKLITARFYAEQILPRAQALSYAVVAGAETPLALAEESF